MWSGCLARGPAAGWVTHKGNRLRGNRLPCLRCILLGMDINEDTTYNVLDYGNNRVWDLAYMAGNGPANAIGL